jgi:hypothetical protein
VLRPIWVRIRPFVEPKRAAAPPKKQPSPPETWTGPTLSAASLAAPIRVLTGPEFEAVAQGSPTYYKGRRGYMSAAANVADHLIETYHLTSALELGPHIRPLIVGADVMDRDRPPDLQTSGQIVIHDATKTPWPFEDKAYDLFVGLQVFEHLVGKQHEAFQEVRRVARHAVISLPIDWVMKDPTNCHHQISNERALSWFEPVVPTHIEIGTPGPTGKRLIYVFENLAP